MSHLSSGHLSPEPSTRFLVKGFRVLAQEHHSGHMDVHLPPWRSSRIKASVLIVPV